MKPIRFEIEKNFQEDYSIPRVGDRVQVYRQKNKKYYPGNLSSFDVKYGKHLDVYDDVDVEDLLFATEK